MPFVHEYVKKIQEQVFSQNQWHDNHFQPDPKQLKQGLMLHFGSEQDSDDDIAGYEDPDACFEGEEEFPSGRH